MSSLLQELDLNFKEANLNFEEAWECPGDIVRFKRGFENERIHEFLVGLNHDSEGEVFYEVRRDESRRKTMFTKIGPLEWICRRCCLKGMGLL